MNPLLLQTKIEAVAELSGNCGKVDADLSVKDAERDDIFERIPGESGAAFRRIDVYLHDLGIDDPVLADSILKIFIEFEYVVFSP